MIYSKLFDNLIETTYMVDLRIFAHNLHTKLNAALIDPISFFQRIFFIFVVVSAV